MKFLKRNGAGALDPAPLTTAEDGNSDSGPARGPGLAQKLRQTLGRNRAATRPVGATDAAATEAVARKDAPAPKARPARKSAGLTGDVMSEADGVVAIGKKKFAVGIYWTTPDDTLKPKAQVKAINEANESNFNSRAPKYQLFVDPKRTGFLGLAALDLGHTPGMPTLITTFPLEEVGNRWIGVFLIDQTNDLWWIGAVRDGKIFEDRMIKGRGAAQEAFLSELMAPDWQSVFAPSDWGIRDTRPDALVDLINPKIGHRVSSIDPLRSYLPRILIGVSGLALLVGSYVAYTAHQAAQLAELEEIRKKAEAEVTIGPSDYPWDRVTPMPDFLSLCRQNIEKLIAPVPGWEMLPISCTIAKGSGTVSTEWEQKGGRISWLRSGMPKDLPYPTLSPDGKKASVSFKFQAPVIEDSWTQQPWEPARMEVWLREIFQNRGLDLTMKPNKKNVATASAAPVFNSHDIQITTGVGLSNYGDLVAKVPALVPAALLYNAETMNFDLILKVYHPPLLPEAKKQKKK